MPAVNMSGTWQFTVVDKESLYAQRLVFSGDVQKILELQVGMSASASGRRWRLRFEHNRGDGVWRPNVSVEAGAIVRCGNHFQRLITTKDVYWTGDREHDDLKLLLTRPASAGAPEEGVDGVPFAVDVDLYELPEPLALPPVDSPDATQERLRSYRQPGSAGTPLRRRSF
ncbi:hypothetical protein ONA91_24490 [Micromonospora sp. DR5-3]|uniref:hypothetical protein n=1 Tax=unclassified Micromonospora TaxID=2617518 RepID=UPI0011D6C998|nr:MULTISPECIES: hypothetical protein [unclassified Micromonospora]MCW3817618.1 hypothetical protein [Micromonospora sp. DR5-3]TYC19616.1 hypothetical protein FXF52_35625 [Micromonospora sp. MP36]